MIIGELIKNRREELGLTQKNLADKLGKKRSSITFIENKGKDISVILLEEIAEALSCDLSYFFPSQKLKRPRVLMSYNYGDENTNSLSEGEVIADAHAYVSDLNPQLKDIYMQTIKQLDIMSKAYYEENTETKLTTAIKELINNYEEELSEDFLNDINTLLNL